MKELRDLKALTIHGAQPTRYVHTTFTPTMQRPLKFPPFINVQWFRGGLVFEAHRLLYHSAEGLRTFQDL